MKKIEILSMTDEKLDKVVKIQGTPYDRKRKVPEKILERMGKLWDKGKSISYIADKFGLNYGTVRYNVDEQYRATYNANRNGAHTGKDHITVKDRVAYKRQLVALGKVSA